MCVRVGGLCCALLFMNRESVGGWCDMIMIGDGGVVIVVPGIGVLGRIAECGVLEGKM